MTANSILSNVKVNPLGGEDGPSTSRKRTYMGVCELTTEFPNTELSKDLQKLQMIYYYFY